MKFLLPIQLALLTTLGLGVALAVPPQPLQAVEFDKLELEPAKFIIIASPIGTTESYKLLIFEQLNNRRLCWQEIPGTPTTIDPLFLQFDFTKVCGRSTDSNAYSVRVGDEDLAGRYQLRLVKKQNELVVVAYSLIEKTLPKFEIGRTRGLAEGYIKIDLDPGWRLTRRVFNGKQTGHLYFTTDRTMTELASQTDINGQPIPNTSTQQSPTIPSTELPAQPSPPSIPSPTETAPAGSVPLQTPPAQNLNLPSPPATGNPLPAESVPGTQTPTGAPTSSGNRQNEVIPTSPGNPSVPQPMDTPQQVPNK
jgi:N-acetylmuramoyl-L-alanine amidase